ncbi:RHS repeat-associated core domain-containing protein [Pseudomonas sp. Z4-20]|uniref:RHS repeat-associated core domain-containing protein n=1 Tax=Pseudomonas sp. Z4-20 TaxID=2817414 RepID=UPI003DA880AC
MSAIHSRTPDVVAFNCQGLAVRRGAYLRSQASPPPTALITQQRFNVAGQLVEQWDPRLFGNAPKPNQATVYNLLGEPLHTDSVDAGWRLALPGLAGETLQLWNARGSHWRTSYDDQLRPVALEENGQANVDTFAYGDATADTGHNLRGQLLEQTDPSGTLNLDSYGLLGLPLRQARVIAASDAYVTEQTFDTLGALIRQTDAGGHQQDMRLDVAGQLIWVSLQLKQDAARQPLLLAAYYNAAGQIERQDAANGVISRWTYDPADGRLSTLQAGKPSEAPRQNLAYVYDPVGNVLRIEDHTVTTVHFANQRVDGHRDFTYDSLYRLTGASGFEGDTPHLQPGLPAPIIPIDPNRLFNYSQRYEYDVGNNLTRLRHVREGNNHTQIMRIDPNSNRGVRWKDGDPEPDFDTLFDAHGNQLFLQPGTPQLAWNPRDQLSNVTVIERDNGVLNDDETYLYSQGERVGKIHATTGMVRQTHYLPGLEVRICSDGEALHVITLGLAYGNVRCLHWETGQPGGIEADQLRYSLDDHLGSDTVELDRHGGLIGLEFFYPFGGTAWQAGRSLVEVGYKTVRYSGKEMDESGLYYYGARYYAPWLQRWVSADPARDVDGLNMYAFVGNNPVRYLDDGGTNKLKWEIMNYSDFISELGTESATALKQIDSIITQSGIKTNLLKNLVGESIGGALGFAGGFVGGEAFASVAPRLNDMPYVGGLVGGNIGGDTVGALSDAILPTARLIRPLIPQTSAMSVEAIDRRLGFRDAPLTFSISDFPSFFMNRVVGSVIPGMNFLSLAARAQEAEDIKTGLTPMKIQKIDKMLAEWKEALESRWTSTEAAFDTLGTTVIKPGEVLPNVNYMTTQETPAPIHRSTLQQKTRGILDYIDRAQKGMASYKESRTTDNQFLLKRAKGPRP